MLSLRIGNAPAIHPPILLRLAATLTRRRKPILRSSYHSAGAFSMGYLQGPHQRYTAHNTTTNTMPPIAPRLNAVSGSMLTVVSPFRNNAAGMRTTEQTS